MDSEIPRSIRIDQERNTDISVLSITPSISKYPYPYLGTHTPNDRFQWDRNGYFIYYGREAFHSLTDSLENMRIGGYKWI
ncbi:hypothetical protein BDZ91DRAFT_113999 [Kalaharituber pfeilii]|nr:hypothetical protein BDZ91DRAFT_113999 [Kalaharituber pfeilii]